MAGQTKRAVPADVAVDTPVDLGPVGQACGIAARLRVSLPGMDRAQAQALALVGTAHQRRPAPTPPAGNIDVTITLA